jgi:hypothetical protein
MPAATRTTLTLACPECGDSDSGLVLVLSDLPTCRCEGCGAEFTPADAAEKLEAELARWRKLSAWIKAAPDLG